MAANNTVPLSTIAKLLDLTERRVNQLAKDGVLPKSARGRYELVPVVRAYIRFLREKTVNTDVGADDYAAHRARLTSAKADMAEMEREQMKSNLIPADDVADAWDAMVSNMRAKLLSIPTKSATQTFAAKNVTEAKSILKDAVNDALKELAAIQVKTVNPVRASVDEDSAQDAQKPSTAA
jgi:phage terminase Nu1 subunit (DNA packaging protein)|tara:strand:- start:295 stop:834 length:540 start_codon:yes stop_codon:yes gene_type:complete